MTVNPYKTSELNSIEIIDELAEILENKSYDLEIEPADLGISTEDKFIAHCSNIQAWIEHNSHTRIIHSKITFYVLKKVYELGDLPRIVIKWNCETY